MRLNEVKRLLNGKIKDSFDIALKQHARGRYVVGLYTIDTEMTSKRFKLDIGSKSWGVWPLNGKEAYWGAYRIHSPDGKLLRYRLDCLSDVVVDDSEVSSNMLTLSFTDLLLDATVTKPENGGKPIVRFEDEDEVEKAMIKGQLSELQLNNINLFKSELLSNCEQILRFIDDAIEASERQSIQPRP